MRGSNEARKSFRLPPALAQNLAVAAAQHWRSLRNRRSRPSLWGLKTAMSRPKLRGWGLQIEFSLRSVGAPGRTKWCFQQGCSSCVRTWPGAQMLPANPTRKHMRWSQATGRVLIPSSPQIALLMHRNWPILRHWTWPPQRRLVAPIRHIATAKMDRRLVS